MNPAMHAPALGAASPRALVAPLAMRPIPALPLAPLATLTTPFSLPRIEAPMPAQETVLQEQEAAPAPSQAPPPPHRTLTLAPRVIRPFVEHAIPPPPALAAPPAAPQPAVTRQAPIRRMFPPIEAREPRGLFGLLPAPMVEGDFVAAAKQPDGRWLIVQPRPEPFPNSWQRRVLLWFAISFALVAPLGWLFARRVVGPIAGFARAAEQLGRDPGGAAPVRGGPAEIGRAVLAFNRMQSRLRSFVEDRTTMVSAISHDLRTPLTRLRFRIEEAPADLRQGMLDEVEEMEQMIASVLSFAHNAAEQGSREILDLRSILEDVIEDAVFVGKKVTMEGGEAAAIEADPLGIRRLLANLVENAVKYGDSAHVRLFTEQQDAVAEIRDDGPGLPEEELENVFRPFYRTPAARNSAKRGDGLGLAVCRSIARAHGGDVRLNRADSGLVAQLRLPLAYAAGN
jgi:signal transduction histidine kinase